MAKVDGLAETTPCVSGAKRGSKRHIILPLDGQAYAANTFCRTSFGRDGIKYDALRDFKQNMLCETCVKLALGKPFVFAIVRHETPAGPGWSAATWFRVTIEGDEDLSFSTPEEASERIDTIVAQYEKRYGSRFVAQVVK